VIAKVLFPVDFSPACVAMVPYVKRAAGLFGARVTTVYVCDLVSHNGFELCVRAPQEIAEEHLGIARERLAAFLNSEFRGCESVLRSGDAAEEISEVARSGAFDLIIMPTHAGRFRRMLLGSTTAKVLNDAECPVMTTEHAESAVPRPLEHLLWVCAIGLSDDSERVLRLANSHAAAVGARLSIIHATEDVSEDKARRRLEDLLQAVVCEAEIQIATGRVKDAILGAASLSAADALIIGRQPLGGSSGRLRDLTYTLVRDSPCPVLSV
jgi:nucleotide-binding universal stress UspA family protein